MTVMEKANKIVEMFEELNAKGCKMPCIRVLRGITRLSLKEAKTMFEVQALYSVEQKVKQMTLAYVSDMQNINLDCLHPNDRESFQCSVDYIVKTITK